MDPVAIRIFGIDIMWYGIIISMGVIIALLLTEYTSKLRDVKYDDILTLFLIAFPLAVLGARLYYVIFEFNNYYKDNLGDILNIRQGGLAIHGGVITAVIVVYVYSKKKGLNFFDLVDVMAPSLIIAQSIGRWGNFFNQEAHGGPVSKEFISIFPEFIQSGMFIDGTYYHPTFLYESIWNLLSFGILFYLIHKVRRKGIVFFSYVGLYSLGRFFIEGLRTDSLMMGPIRTAQLISVIGIIICIVGLVLINRKKEQA
jgi:phosphatidylglycerol---prolipoprotein diacylglyceryl transferase